MWALLNQPERFPEWWPSFERAELQSGEAGAIGAVYRYRVRGSAGLVFDFTLQIEEKRAPTHLRLKAAGDFLGSGVWHLQTNHSQTSVTYLWQVEVTRPLLGLLAGLPGARGYMERSHDKVMAQGGENLARLLGSKVNKKNQWRQMMRNIFQTDTRQQLRERAGRLQRDTPARWGKSNAHQIVCHLSDQLRMALGEIPGAPVNGVLGKWPLNKLLIYLLPWPKGAPTPREAWSTPPQDWEKDLEQFHHLLERLAAEENREQWPAHPLFGGMNARDWGRLTYRHIDHHLRQFGV